MAKQLLSKEGYEKLVHELHILKEQKLPSTLERLKDAIGQGDISENAEYDSAILEKDLTEARISELEILLKDVEIVQEGTGKKSDEIRYGSLVKVKLIESNPVKEYLIEIVGSGEVDIDADPIRLSFESGIGQAIQGKKVGDVVKVKAPKGKYDVQIMEVN